MPGWLSELMSQEYCTAFLTGSIFLEVVEFMHEKWCGSMKPYSQMCGVCSQTWSFWWVQLLLARMGGWTSGGRQRSPSDTDSSDSSHCTLCSAGYKSGCCRWTRLWSFPKRPDLDFRKPSPSFSLLKKGKYKRLLKTPVITRIEA